MTTLKLSWKKRAATIQSEWKNIDMNSDVNEAENEGFIHVERINESFQNKRLKFWV